MEFLNKKLNELNLFLMNKKIAIIGLGVSNLPLVDYLYNLNAKITIFDKMNISQIDEATMDKLIKKKIELSLGNGYLSNLKGFDIIFRSPSCRPDLTEIQEEVKRGAVLTSEIELVLEVCPGKTIGVTGSDGKTTTTSLIYEILKGNGHNCFLGGNIGIPLFTQLAKMKSDDYIILELSSFQLMNMKVSPSIAVITNITPNHLDIHKSYEEYIEAKKKIFQYQKETDLLVLNYDDEITSKFETEANGKVYFFSRNKKISNGFMLDGDYVISARTGKKVLNVRDVKLRGKHNYENICTALTAVSDIVDLDKAVNIVKEFPGVEHRIEYIREINGAKWYNDSIGSSPTRTIAGLYSFDENIILIAGGYDKHLDYEPIANPILEKVGTLILMGQTTDKIYNAVMTKNESEKLEIHKVQSLEEAVEKAYESAKKGDVVLFSPASASFDMFKNFMERGDKFKELVNKI